MRRAIAGRHQRKFWMDRRKFRTCFNFNQQRRCSQVQWKLKQNRTYKKKPIVTKLYYLYRFTLLLNEGNEEHLAQIVNTNLLGLIYCTKQAYQSMVKHDVEGYIINVGSVFGHALHDMCGSLETFSLYSPSKFALRTATEVLRKELTKLQKHKIRVTVSDTIFFYLCSKQQQLWPEKKLNL